MQNFSVAKEESKKEEAAVEAPKADGGGSKLAPILGIVNLLLTLGIGAVIFLQFQKDKHKESVSDIQPNVEEHAAPSEQGAPAEHGAPAGEHGAPAKDAHGNPIAAKQVGPKIVTLEQFTVNLSTTVGTPPRFARVVIAVELPSEDTSTELTQKMPQVRNAVIDLFNSKRPGDLQNGEGRNFLREEIRNALNSFLITGKVKGVFFSNFAISS
jgi:flagellar FliL protein